jgi:Beta-ketoacyl synthase, N-terminal domain
MTDNAKPHAGTMAIDAPFAAFCSDVAAFDAALFNLAAAEAVTIDPQQRMLIEQTAVALRQAGPGMAEAAAASITSGSSPSSAAAASLTGVYVGCMNHEWLTVMVAHGTKLAPRAFVGNGAAYMVGRLSYTFGLTGGWLLETSSMIATTVVSLVFQLVNVPVAECLTPPSVCRTVRVDRHGLLILACGNAPGTQR